MTPITLVIHGADTPMYDVSRGIYETPEKIYKHEHPRRYAAITRLLKRCEGEYRPSTRLTIYRLGKG